MQARKKKPTSQRKKSTRSSSNVSLSGFVILCFGVVIGVLGTILWQGFVADKNDVGAGIRTIMEKSRAESQQASTNNVNNAIAEPEKLETNYEFYTVLPEMEVVVANPAEFEKPATQQPAKTQDQEKQETEQKKPEDQGGAYMLQAASYKSEADARNMKVDLALQGISSSIQKVTIEGRGDFYRVKVGPLSYAEMKQYDQKLSAAGIRALRLKVIQ